MPFCRYKILCAIHRTKLNENVCASPVYINVARYINVMCYAVPNLVFVYFVHISIEIYPIAYKIPYTGRCHLHLLFRVDVSQFSIYHFGVYACVYCLFFLTHFNIKRDIIFEF